MFTEPGRWTARLAAGFVLALAFFSSAGAGEAVAPVPRAAIYPGDLISEAMLVDRVLPPQTEDDGARAFLARGGLVGKVARQTLLPGRPVPAHAVREPFVIKQGQPTAVIFEAGTLVISATAIPLQPGTTGETISLRNSDSGTTIKGVVQADGTVRVGVP